MINRLSRLAPLILLVTTCRELIRPLIGSLSITVIVVVRGAYYQDLYRAVMGNLHCWRLRRPRTGNCKLGSKSVGLFAAERDLIAKVCNIGARWCRIASVTRSANTVSPSVRNTSGSIKGLYSRCEAISLSAFRDVTAVRVATGALQRRRLSLSEVGNLSAKNWGRSRSGRWGRSGRCSAATRSGIAAGHRASYTGWRVIGLLCGSALGNTIFSKRVWFIIAEQIGVALTAGVADS